MKKTYLFFVVLLIGTTITFSQCIPQPNGNDPVCRGALAGIIFLDLYSDNPNVYDYEAASFPNPFIDLQESPSLPSATNELYAQLKVLSYLAYDNGVTVYNYTNEPSACFKPFSLITKIEGLIYFMEAWNIEPDFSGSSPFNDIPTNDVSFGYVNRAVNEGLIPGGGNFNPFDLLDFDEATDYRTAILNSQFHPVNEDLNDLDNYFIPGIYTPFNISQTRGLNQGVFNHYAKDSFVIPDIKMSLNFSHFYSTTLVELPEDFYPIKPLGRGWSHTYNSYIIRENNVGFDEVDYYFIVWPDGTIHIYNEDDEEYESIGVYDELAELDGGDRIRVRKKNQMDYFYERLDNDKAIWYLVEIEDTNNNEINIDYESSDIDNDLRRIEYVESPSGKRLEFEYDNNTDFIERITDPIGREITFDLDPDDDNRLEEFVDARGNETRYIYIENDVDVPFGDQINRFLMDEIELPRGNSIHAEYDENAKLTSYQIDDDDPTEIDVDYDYDNSEMTVMVTTPTPDGGELNEMNEFNMNGLIVDYESEIDDLNVEYPTNGPNVTLPDNSNLNGVHIDYEFDDNGNVLEIDKEFGTAVEEMTYSDENELLSYTDPNNNETNFTYDNNRNLLEIEDPFGNSTFMTYDNNGQMLTRTNQEGITTEYTYENDGAVATMTAPEDITSAYQYDGINRLLLANNSGLISTYEYDNNDNITEMVNSGGFVTTYDYDENDNLVDIINPNNISTAFVYDDEDRPITETFGNLVKTYEYDDEGFMDRYTKPSGDQIDYDYDNNGRVTETGTITDTQYNNDNLVESISNDAGIIDFDYDVLNRVDRVTTVHGFDVEYAYRPSNHLAEIVYPTINGIPVEVDFTYDDKNRVENVRIIRDGEERIIAEYEYLDDDRISRIEYPNDVRTNYLYDNAARHKRLEHIAIGNGNLFYDHINELDNRGNIIETVEFARPVENTLDPSQLLINYSYDDNSHIEVGATTDFNVDDDGNTVEIAGGDIALQYDIDDRLTDYNDLDSNFDFEYNPYNQRVEVTRDGQTTRFVRDVMRDNILIELNNSNNPIYYYIYDPNGMLLARMNPDGDLQFYHADIRGSITAITDEDANITHLYRYDDFGMVIGYTEPDNDNNRFKYVGCYGVETDTDDLYYMRARYYRPTIGRFLTEDPVWSTNLYPYADNNPVSRIDPEGMMASSLYNQDPLDIALELSVSVAEENVNRLEQQLVDEYLVNGKFSIQTQFLLATNEIWANPWSRNALLFPLQKGKGFKSAAGKGITKIFGKTGFLKLIDMRTKDGRLLKDFGDYLYEQSLNEFKGKIIKR